MLILKTHYYFFYVYDIDAVNLCFHSNFNYLGQSEKCSDFVYVYYFVMLNTHILLLTQKCFFQLINQLDVTGPPPLSKEKINEIPTVEICQEQVGKSPFKLIYNWFMYCCHPTIINLLCFISFKLPMTRAQPKDFV